MYIVRAVVIVHIRTTKEPKYLHSIEPSTARLRSGNEIFLSTCLLLTFLHSLYQIFSTFRTFPDMQKVSLCAINATDVTAT